MARHRTNDSEREQRLADVATEAAGLSAADDRLTEAVRAARTAGASWADIGGAVGIARQSAHERWAKAVGEPVLAEPREIDIDPATITRLDAREEINPVTGTVRQRMTVGTAPDGTPVLLTEASPPTGYPTGEGWPVLADRPLHRVWAYNSLAAARRDRDEQITRGYRTAAEIAEHIRDVP